MLAAATPLLVALVRGLYLLVGGTEALGLAAATAVRIVLAALVLGALSAVRPSRWHSGW